MALVPLKCSQCGANLPAPDCAGTCRCEFCGRLHLLEDPVPEPRSGAPARATGRAPLAGISIILALAVAVPGAVTWLSKRPAKRAAPGPGPSSAAAGIAAASASPQRMIFDRVGGPPLALSVDDRELVIGRVRLYPADELFLVAVHPATMKEAWRIGPLGTYSEGYRNTFFVAAGARLAVTDFRSRLYLHELSSGKLLKTIELTDRAKQMCRSGPASVSLQQVDDRSFSIDLDSASLSPLAGQQVQCRSTFFPPREGSDAASLGRFPGLSGFRPLAVRLGEELGVAGGVRSPGTALPRVAGFEAKIRKVTWTADLALADPASVRPDSNAFDALAGDRYFATYGVGSKAWHLAALDARNGARLWDVALRPVFAVDQLYGLVATSSFVYVSRTSSLEVFDAATGRQVGTLGDDGYEK